MGGKVRAKAGREGFVVKEMVGMLTFERIGSEIQDWRVTVKFERGRAYDWIG